MGSYKPCHHPPPSQSKSLQLPIIIIILMYINLPDNQAKERTGQEFFIKRANFCYGAEVPHVVNDAPKSVTYETNKG